MWIRRREAATCWLIHRDFDRPELLRRLNGPGQLMAPEAVLIPRSAALRSTELVRARLPELPDTALVIKRYRPVNSWQSLKEFFRPSRAHRSFALAFRLRLHEIPTPTPIAAGEVRRWRWLRDSYLISEEIHGARTLWQVRLAATNSRQVRALARAFASFLARFHDAGLSHTDANLSNFLVCGDPYPTPLLMAIDLDGVRPRRRVSPRTAAMDLSRLVRYMAPRESLWFIAQYCRTRKVRLRAREFRRLLLRHLTADPPGFAIVRAAGLRWTIRRGTVSAELQRVLENPDSFLIEPRLLFKHSRTVTVGRVPPASGTGGAGLVLRRVNYGKWIHRLRDAFRRSRVQRALKSGLLLEQAGVPTPRAFAAADVHRFCWPGKAYLITEEVPGAVTLAAAARCTSWLPRPLCLALADVLARLHEAGFSHRDLKASNILLDDQLRPWLIDLDGVRHFRRLSEARVVADLARLAREFAASPILLRWSGRRFLLRYCASRKIRAAFRRLDAKLRREL